MRLAAHASPYQFEQLNIRCSPEEKSIWCFLNAKPRACFNIKILTELKDFLNQLYHDNDHGAFYQYLVISSLTPNVFNLGGDLKLFIELSEQRNYIKLMEYATLCIDVIYQNLLAYQHGITTISLINGDALGGGFEAALSSEIIIAEKQAKFGLPEIMINLFPGMGAYSFLARKLNPKLAERIILSGEIYNSEHLFNLGLVDVLADPSQGETAVHQFIVKNNKVFNGANAIRKISHDLNKITYEELMEITRVWVDTVCSLKKEDIRKIKMLIYKQEHLI